MCHQLGAWFPNHGPEQTMPALKATMDYLKSRGVKEFAAVGYCFGARYVFNLSYDGLIKVGAVNHPSLIQPEDIEKIGKTGVPILFNVSGSFFLSGHFDARLTQSIASLRLSLWTDLRDRLTVPKGEARARRQGTRRKPRHVQAKLLARSDSRIRVSQSSRYADCTRVLGFS